MSKKILLPFSLSLILILGNACTHFSPMKDTTYLINAEQDEFLSKNLNHLAFYGQLATKGKTVEEIKKEHHLSSASVKKYIHDLTKIGLIVWDEQAKTLQPISLGKKWGWVALDKTSISVAKREIEQYRELYQKIFAEEIRTKQQPPAEEFFTKSAGLRLNGEEFVQFQKEYKELIDKYFAISLKNKAKNPKYPSVYINAFGKANWAPDYFTQIKNLK